MTDEFIGMQLIAMPNVLERTDAGILVQVK
jgi:hypothetical protein